MTVSERMERSAAWRALDAAWVWLMPAIGAVLCALGDSPAFLFTFLFSGVLCVVLAARGKIWTYPIGMYNSVAYAWVAWGDRLYGEVMLNLLFFVPMNVAGFVLWRKKMRQQQCRVAMRAQTWRARAAVALIVVACTAVGGWGLARIPGQNTPCIDAFTNVVSITATFLMVWRYKEQWLLYIILNVATILMWAIWLHNGSEAGWTMVAMWSLFLVNACYGYAKWSFGARADARQAAAGIPVIRTTT
jgi:nicotinamide mononucleotide transporter